MWTECTRGKVCGICSACLREETEEALAGVLRVEVEALLMDPDEYVRHGAGVMLEVFNLRERLRGRIALGRDLGVWRRYCDWVMAQQISRGEWPEQGTADEDGDDVD